MSRIRFAAGKGSALVVDIGHSMASITPVVDGFVLRKGKPRQSLWRAIILKRSGLVSSALPKLVHAHAKHILTNPTPTRNGIELYPHQLIATKNVWCNLALVAVTSHHVIHLSS
jgi:actin-like protein 6B